VGLRHPHYAEVLKERPPVDWFEVHSENFFHQGGPAVEGLLEVRKHYPISLHGVGLSLGSAKGVEKDHLIRLKELMAKVDPFLLSEHLSWSFLDGRFVPDLLPIPYNAESFDVLCRNIETTQDFLGREILIENPSSYLEFQCSTQEEVGFLVSLCESTGAKMLLDVNNVFVSSSNHGWDPKQYIHAIPKHLVKEIHLAGHSTKEIGNQKILRIDTHDNFVCQEVWELYALAIQRFGSVSTLLEWDDKIPALSVLVNEALKAREYLEQTEVSHATA